MVYRLLGWGMVDRAYDKIKDTECLLCYIVQKFYLIMEVYSA